MRSDDLFNFELKIDNESVKLVLNITIVNDYE